MTKAYCPAHEPRQKLTARHGAMTNCPARSLTSVVPLKFPGEWEGRTGLSAVGGGVVVGVTLRGGRGAHIVHAGTGRTRRRDQFAQEQLTDLLARRHIQGSLPVGVRLQWVGAVPEQQLHQLYGNNKTWGWVCRAFIDNFCCTEW